MSKNPTYSASASSSSHSPKSYRLKYSSLKKQVSELKHDLYSKRAHRNEVNDEDEGGSVIFKRSSTAAAIDSALLSVPGLAPMIPRALRSSVATKIQVYSGWENVVRDILSLSGGGEGAVSALGDICIGVMEDVLYYGGPDWGEKGEADIEGCKMWIVGKVTAVICREIKSPDMIVTVKTYAKLLMMVIKTLKVADCGWVANVQGSEAAVKSIASVVGNCYRGDWPSLVDQIKSRQRCDVPLYSTALFASVSLTERKFRSGAGDVLKLMMENCADDNVRDVLTSSILMMGRNVSGSEAGMAAYSDVVVKSVILHGGNCRNKTVVVRRAVGYKTSKVVERIGKLLTLDYINDLSGKAEVIDFACLILRFASRIFCHGDSYVDGLCGIVSSLSAGESYTTEVNDVVSKCLGDLSSIEVQRSLCGKILESINYKRYRADHDAIKEATCRVFGDIKGDDVAGRMIRVLRDGKVSDDAKANAGKLLKYGNDFSSKKSTFLDYLMGKKTFGDDIVSGIIDGFEENDIEIPDHVMRSLLCERKESANVMSSISSYFARDGTSSVEIGKKSRDAKGTEESHDSIINALEVNVTSSNAVLRKSTINILSLYLLPSSSLGRRMNEDELKACRILCEIARADVGFENFRNVREKVIDVTFKISTPSIRRAMVPHLTRLCLSLLRFQFSDIWDPVISAVRECVKKDQEGAWGVVWEEIGREEYSKESSNSSYLKSLFSTIKFRPSLIQSNITVILPAYFDALKFTFAGGRSQGTSPILNELGLSASLSSSTRIDSAKGNGAHLLHCYLELLTSLPNPSSIESSSELRKSFVSLLTSDDSTIANLALSGLLSYKSKSINAYKDVLTSLLSSSSLRETLSVFSIDSVQGEHRIEFATIFVRLLYGRLGRKGNAGKGKGKDTQSTRRAYILGYLSSLEAAELEQFVYLSLRGLCWDGWGGSEDPKVVVDWMLKEHEKTPNCFAEKVPHRRKVGFLNLLEGMVASLGFKVESFVDGFVQILFALLKDAQIGEKNDVDEEDDDDDDNDDDDDDGDNDEDDDNDTQKSGALSNLTNCHIAPPASAKARSSVIRGLAIKRLTQIMTTFSPSVDFSVYSQRLWTILSSSLLKLPSSLIGTVNVRPPALLSMIENLTGSPDLVLVLSNSSHEADPISSLLDCMSPSSSASSIASVLRSFENLLNEPEGVEIVKGRVCELVDKFALLMESTADKTGKICNRQVNLKLSHTSASDCITSVHTHSHLSLSVSPDIL